MSIESDYKGHCLTCSNYEPTTRWSDMHSEKGFWCKRHSCWSDPYDKCSGYSKSYNGSSFLEDCMKELNKKRNYFIITICTAIMNLPLNNEYRMNFKELENKYLAGTLDGEKLLDEYDYYGKQIGDIILLEYANFPKETTLVVQNEYMPQIIKINEFYKHGKVKEAIMLYTIFVRRLMKKYCIELEDVCSKNIYDHNLQSSIVDEYSQKFQRVLSK